MNTRLEPDDERADVLENAIRALRETPVPAHRLPT